MTAAGLVMFLIAMLVPGRRTVPVAVALAPAGGTLLMAGWLLLAFSRLRDPN